MSAIEVAGGAGIYGVHVGAGLLARAGELVRAAGLAGRVAVVHDAGSAPHLPPLLRSLAAAGLGAFPIEVPRGEAAKTLAVAERLWGSLASAGLHRGDVVLALGGGAVGDAAGFAAATYHRGVPFVVAPTTLLAQVDASIGGKVAIDHPLAKNLVGAFHAPRLVLADVDALATLGTRERHAGLAEVVKAALVGDAELFASLEADLEALGGGAAEPGRLAEVVERAVRVKAAIVSRDEREAGERLLLNLGHTVGHAIEAAAGFGPILHGEAVVLGLRAAVAVSRRHALAAPEAERILALLARFPPPAAPLPRREAVIETAGRDKKRAASGLRFVVLNRIGAASVLPDLSAGQLEVAVDSALGNPA